MKIKDVLSLALSTSKPLEVLFLPLMLKNKIFTMASPLESQHTAGHPEITQKDIQAIRHDFLMHPINPSKITKTDLDFKGLDVRYDGLYATVIDNAFTPSECATLISLAEAHTNGIWEQAMINVGGGRQQLMTDARDCGRIIWDDAEVTDRIWARVKNFVPEIQLLRNVPKVTGLGPAKRRETWWCGRLNERMRVLKYGEGQYFRRGFGCSVHLELY